MDEQSLNRCREDEKVATALASVDRAACRIAAGRPVIVVDDRNRENEGDLVYAAEAATPELVGFTMRHTAGVICVPMLGEELERLDLPQMREANEDAKGTAFAVSVDARAGITTGISGADRARTIQLLADPATSRSDLARPGHVFPLRAQPRGVLVRPGHTEAAVDLVRLAGLRPVGVISEIVNDDGTMARLPDLMTFSERHQIPIVSIADLITWRLRHERQVLRRAEVTMPTRTGEFRAVGFSNRLDDSEDVTLVKGDIGDGEDVLVSLHFECLTGNVFHSARCDCGVQLDAAIDAIELAGRGVLVYMRARGERWTGLLGELQAHAEQTRSGTSQAVHKAGVPGACSYGLAAQMLIELGVKSVRLERNCSSTQLRLDGYGLRILDTEPAVIAATIRSPRSLTTRDLVPSL
jgi:3,4-dihydroxy 2-butanone 4-phosphate synthase/GTP cyclohydrolase II